MRAAASGACSEKETNLTFISISHNKAQCNISATNCGLQKPLLHNATSQQPTVVSRNHCFTMQHLSNQLWSPETTASQCNISATNCGLQKPLLHNATSQQPTVVSRNHCFTMQHLSNQLWSLETTASQCNISATNCGLQKPLLHNATSLFSDHE